jgi:predicted transposase/invertase (TIGR01784 family)
MEKKSLFYWSKAYANQIGKGGQYRDLKKTICINILNFRYFKIENFHSIYHILEDKTGIKMTDDLEIHFIEMPKIENMLFNLEDKFLEWLLFLKDPNNLKMEVIMEKEPKIKKAMTVLEFISQDEKERMLYESRERAILNYTSDIARAEEKGMERGKTSEKMKIAKKLLSILDIDTISNLTGLGIEEIKKLKNE